MRPTESPHPARPRRAKRHAHRLGRALDLLHKLVTGAAALAALLRLLL